MYSTHDPTADNATVPACCRFELCYVPDRSDGDHEAWLFEWVFDWLECADVAAAHVDRSGPDPPLINVTIDTNLPCSAAGETDEHTDLVDALEEVGWLLYTDCSPL